MKKILYALLFLFIVNCEKESEPTTYSFTNKYSESIYGFKTFTDVDDYTGAPLDVVNHGKLNISESTEIITTVGDKVFALYSFDISTNIDEMVFYVTEDGFELRKNIHNEFTVSNSTDIYGGTTYYVLNNSNETIYNVESYYQDGSSYRDIKSHATLKSGVRSFHVLTDKPKIGVEYEITGKEGRFVTTFSIVINKINKLIIDQETLEYIRNNLKSIKDKRIESTLLLRD